LPRYPHGVDLREDAWHHRVRWFPRGLFQGEPLSAEILRVHPDEPEPDRVKYIVSCLRAGSVVGMPTDTFYGLAVDPVNLHAVESIYEIKSRLKHKPLSLLIAEVEQAYDLARDLGRNFDVL